MQRPVASEQNEYCEDCFRAIYYDDEDDDEDYYDDWQERHEEELAERAASCKCGAWQIAKDGSVVHVADCCCGAE